MRLTDLFYVGQVEKGRDENIFYFLLNIMFSHIYLVRAIQKIISAKIVPSSSGLFLIFVRIFRISVV